MKALPIVFVLGGLLLTGAGCQKAASPTSSFETPTPTTTIETTTTEQTPTTNSDFSILASSDANNTVQLTWTTPTDMPADATIRVLHSANPNVTFPSRAFWTGLTKDKTSFEWSGVPSGKRYFRACVFVKGACTQYSNEVEIEVK